MQMIINAITIEDQGTIGCLKCFELKLENAVPCSPVSHFGTAGGMPVPNVPRAWVCCLTSAPAPVFPPRS